MTIEDSAVLKKTDKEFSHMGWAGFTFMYSKCRTVIWSTKWSWRVKVKNCYMFYFLVHHIVVFPNGNKYIKVFGTILFCHDWEMMILFNLVAFFLNFCKLWDEKKLKGRRGYLGKKTKKHTKIKKKKDGGSNTVFRCENLFLLIFNNFTSFWSYWHYSSGWTLAFWRPPRPLPQPHPAGTETSDCSHCVSCCSCCYHHCPLGQIGWA